MKAPDIWSLLGIDATADSRAIRGAYAAQLKAIDIDADPEHYAALRSAREEALRLAAEGIAQADPRDARWHDPEPEDGDAGVEEAGLRLAVHPFRPLAVESAVAATATISPVGATDLQRFTVETGVLRSVAAAGAVPGALPPGLACTFQPPLIDAASAGTIPAFADQPHDDNDHYNGILAILFPNGERREDMPVPEQEAALLAHFDAIIHGPRIGEMAYFADAERWFGDIVAHGAPASNCLMAPAADFFRWRERAGELAEADTVAFINRRLKVLEFIEQVSRQDHPWHRAWRELTTYAHERSRRGWGVKRQHVRELLEAVRRDCPDAEGYLDGTRVALWENGSDWSNLSWGYILIGPILLLVVIGRCSEMVNESNRQIEVPAWMNVPISPQISAPVPATPDQRADIDRALRAIGYRKLALATIEQRNPELASTLKSNWLLAAGDRSRMMQLPTRLREALSARTRMAIGSASYEVVAGLRRIELERAELYRARDAALCDDLFRLGMVRPLPGSEALEQRQASLVEDMLLETTELTPRRSADVAIPGDVVARIIDRTKLSEGRVHAALAGGGDATDRCDVRIALLRALLDLPPAVGLDLLRSI